MSDAPFSVTEEGLEAKSNETGKLLAANDEDRDSDGIPDFADGFNFFSDDTLEDNTDDNAPPTAQQNGQFVPVIVEVSGKIDLSKATFQFTYNASDPSGVSRAGAGTDADPYVYSPASGKMRLWTKDGITQRNKSTIDDGGDFIDSLTGADTYVASDWAKIGITDSTRTTTLYAEGIAPNVQKGDLTLSFKIDFNGDAGGTQFATGDVVKFSVVDVDVLIGADTVTDESRHDDWVAAKNASTNHEHRILNWLRIDGPNGLEQQLDIQQKNGTGGGSVVLQAFNLDGTPGATGDFTRTLTDDGSGDEKLQFVIGGNAVSSAPDDLSVTASFKGQMLGGESLTVIQFNYVEEVGSEPRPVPSMTSGNYIVNPAIRRNTDQIFAFDVGNSKVTDARKNDAYYIAGTSPALNNVVNGRPISKKFGAQTIEVAWGRQIQGAAAGAMTKFYTDGSANGSTLSIAAAGRNGSFHSSNLRVTDNSIAGTGVDGSDYVYYLGHPTENKSSLTGIVNEYAAKVVVPTKADLVYNLNFSVLSPNGTLASASLTLADINQIVSEASAVWEQIGVRLTWSGTPTIVTTTVTAELDLPNDNTSTLTGITTKTRANGLDIFMVNSIAVGGGNYLSGAAAYENQFGVSDQETGVVMARRKTSPTSAMENVSVLARTMTHEIGHLIFNNADHENSKPWNLMRGGEAGSTNNADLTLDQRDNLSILPAEYNVDETW